MERKLNTTILAIAFALLFLGCRQTTPVDADSVDRRLPPLVEDEPSEFRGEPKAVAAPPTTAMKALYESEVLQTMDPTKPETLRAAIAQFDEVLAREPKNSVVLYLRGWARCLSSADPQFVIEDITAAIESRNFGAQGWTEDASDLYALLARVQLDFGDVDRAMQHLDQAIAEDYDGAGDFFNDGEVEPSDSVKPCKWTRPDLRRLAKARPTDFRPPLYQALYEAQVLKLEFDADYTAVLDLLKRSSELSATSPLPDYFTGKQSLGGLFSTSRAQCLFWVEPRMPACLALDEQRSTGLRAFTRALARDPLFAPAYAARANSLYHQGEYRQAVRDFDKALELLAVRSGERRDLYNDRGLSKSYLGDYQGAVEDFGRSIAIGCDQLCGSYQNRAKAYAALGEYQRAVDDWGASIKNVMSFSVFGVMGVENFRKLYPEYDAVDDQVLSERLRALFNPQFSLETFSERFLVKSNREPTSVLSDLYIHRGDAYAKLGQPEKAEREYSRALEVFPKFAAPYLRVVDGKPVRNAEPVGR